MGQLPKQVIPLEQLQAILRASSLCADAPAAVQTQARRTVRPGIRQRAAYLSFPRDSQAQSSGIYSFW